MTSLAERRHHVQRMKQKRKNDQLVGKHLGAHVNTPAKCSCWMCGNPRRFQGNSKEAKTLQELSADQLYTKESNQGLE